MFYLFAVIPGTYTQSPEIKAGINTLFLAAVVAERILALHVAGIICCQSKKSPVKCELKYLYHLTM